MFRRICSILSVMIVVLQLELAADNVSIVFSNIIVQYHILCINTFAISGNPAPLLISCPTDGSHDYFAEDSTTTYAITTNNIARRITAVLASNMPHGVTLSVSMVPPKGATKMGFVELSATPRSVVTGISNLAQGSLGITYRLKATAKAAKVTGALNIITYTVGP